MTKRGFTLVELMVVVGILSIIMLVISQPVASVIKYQRESQTTDSLRDNLQFIINKIEKELKTSANVYVDDSGALRFKDQNGGFVTYSFDSANKVMKRNDSEFTDKDVFTVERLRFITRDKPNLAKLVTVSIDAKSVDGKDSVSMQTSVLPVNDKPVIKDGLIVHLDAGNMDSYSGASEAEWVSLVNPAPTTGIIRSGVTHSKNDGGYFSFNGDDGYFNTQVPTISGATNYSASIWINMDNWNKDKDTRFFWHGNYAAMIMKFSPGNSLVSYLRNSNKTDEPRSSFSFTDTLYNKWNHLFITYDGSKSKLYLNGSLRSEVNFTGEIINASSNQLWLGGLPGFNFWTRAKISQVLIYNRALNSSEVEYNYNVTKGRFGIQ